MNININVMEWNDYQIICFQYSTVDNNKYLYDTSNYLALSNDFQ